MAKKPYVIVLGNEKGGTGKSTTAIHIIATLLNQGYQVGSIDVDARQGTLTRYMDNRQVYKNKHNLEAVKLPQHISVMRSQLNQKQEAEAEDRENIEGAIATLDACDFIVIDTAGNDTYISRYAHSFADTLVTPLNDSFIDLDVLCHVDGDTLEIKKLSIYAEWVWEQKKQRAVRDKGSIDWIILRNRLTNIHSKNKERMELVLNAASKRLGFRQVSGFGERVIFREMFNQGLTLLDLQPAGQAMNLSHVAARQELRNLMDAFALPTIEKKLASNL